MERIRSRAQRRARGEYRRYEHLRRGICGAFTIPDKGEGASDTQSVLFQEDLNILMAGLFGTDCVLSGCAVTAQVTPDMTLAVAKGAVLSAGVLLPVTAGNVTITTADATNPRLDYVVVNSAGTKAVRAGTPAAAPKPPALTANDVALCQVYVPANDTAISSTQLTDRKVERGGSATGGGASILLKKTTTPVTFNTTLAQQTYFTVTIPSGLLQPGQVIRVKCGGTYLSNSGTPTWTLAITFGGSTVFQDVTAATTADTDRGAWRVEFDLVCQTTTADHALNGVVMFQTPGAKTAPTTGVGDLAVTTSVNAPINGASTVDSNTADRVLDVRWTMSVSNAAVETVMEYGQAELV